MNRIEAGNQATKAVAADVRGQLVEPWLEATRAALGEMAGTEVSVKAIYKAPGQDKLGELNAVVPITSSSLRALILSFPHHTATGLARRILPEPENVDETLVQDCVGELANVVSGQAKALLAGTPYQFTFSLPKVVVGPNPIQLEEGETNLVIALKCDQGELALRLVIFSP